ncbi:Uncharacterised protein [BD1-7 clade bacterium]|uniref:DUF484 family protein n=1 Tax=BD1-7 clade bacterium TaxID=2029982 RepID=A0A5S9MNX1_9GAMM|nr:Uncharacterised protein [BD1-7 clade bacterium]CAA0085176.1 Uncharacterised protein [BD1-7 clade bacterium]
MMQDATATESPLEAAQVEEYLRNNPTYFLEREHLLTELYLPHASGEAVSLLERQVSLLRERNIDARKRLKEFLEQGERNDELFGNTRRVVTALLEARNLTDLVERLYASCQNEFGVEFQKFTLLSRDGHHRQTQVRCVNLSEAETAVPVLSRIQQCVAGIFREDELKLLFAGDHNGVGSALLLPVFVSGELVAVMAFGSSDVKYFNNEPDTLFLDFIGDVLGRLLPRFV